MKGFDLVAAVQATHSPDAQFPSGSLTWRSVTRDEASVSHRATDLSDALATLAKLPGYAAPEASGRYRSVVGSAITERSAAWQATAVNAVLDSETGVLSIVAVAAIHSSAPQISLSMIEAALAEAIGTAFNWSTTVPRELQVVSGYLAGDQHIPSIGDVPEMRVSLLPPTDAAMPEEALQVAQISMVMALLDALAAAGCVSPLPLPIAPDLVLRQLA